MTTSAGKLNINNNYALGTGYFTIGGASSIDNTSGSDVTLMNNNPITMPTQFTFPGNGNLNLGAGPVTMTGNLQINATNNNLTIGGPMSGPYTLLKTQPGTLTLAGANSYTGNTSVTGGKLKLGANEVIPDGAGKGDIAVTGSAIILDMNGFSETVNALSGTGIIDNSVPGTTSILTVCNDNDTTNFTGSLRNTGGTLALTKAGSGQWTLSGTLNTYSGVTHVAAGTLALSGTGTLASTQIVVSAGATFSVTGRTATARMFLLASNQALLGGGTVEGSVTNSGVVAPGLSAGNLTISEDYGQRTNGALSIEIGGTVAGTTYDVLTVTGAATLNGALNVSPINGYAPASGASFTVLQAASVAGVFASTNLPTLTSGLGWEVTYPGAAVVLSVTGTASGATGYDQWAGAITNGLTNYNDSATGDGYPNLLKYATGSSPTNADNLARMGCTRTSGVFALTFNRNTNALDVTLVVEGSDSVKNDSTWSGIATNKIGAWNPPTVSEAGSGTPVAVTVKDNAASGTNRFLRLRVTRP
jgi:autotransporter-associated beta strand protein